MLRLTLDQDTLDDPLITSREKFVVILNAFCPDDPIYFVMATSKVGRFKSDRKFAAESVELDRRHYPFLNRPTVLDFTGVKALLLIDLTNLYSTGLASIAGQLTASDLSRCDAVIRASRYIEPRVVSLILPW